MKRDPISPYFDIKTDAEGQEYMEVYLEGIALLRLVLSNKGTAFTEDERVALGLDGLLPPQVNTLVQQVERVYRGFLREPDPIAKVPIDHFDGLDKFDDLPRDGKCVGDVWA